MMERLSIPKIPDLIFRMLYRALCGWIATTFAPNRARLAYGIAFHVTGEVRYLELP